MSVTRDTAEYDEETGIWTAYVGSFIGGPLYIVNETVKFTVTISGGVAYRHFILGYTTEAEYKELSKSSAPYFDLEVWDRGVLHSGPLYYAQNFTYEQIYNAAVFWDKVATVATTNGSNQGIVFLYDPFVAAGAAVAFPGQGSVNCPAGWMRESLNYDAMVTSGSWGNLHEYHHNFQNYGIGDTGEVTNNGLNLVTYSLFTKISAARQIGAYGGAGLGGWNSYTSATWALQRVNSNQISSTNGLAVYSTLLHNFGQDIYIKARGSWGAAYLNRYAQLTHQDFSYFAQQVAGYTGGALSPASTTYPTFVPVSSVYQTGRTYSYDGELHEITTMQPYVIPTEQAFTVDLRPYTATDDGQYQSGSIIIGTGFKFNIKEINAKGISGKWEETETEGVYKYTPDGVKPSGKIYVTLGITQENGDTTHRGIELDDVTLVLQFQPSRESTKLTLERTTYEYAAENMYTDAEEAYNAKFAGYENMWSGNNNNPTQNANTDIWFWTETNASEEYFEQHPDHLIRDNRVLVIDGKLLFEDLSKYRVYLRGRVNCALYFSLDGKNYSLGATIKDTTTGVMYNANYLFRNDPNTYFDIEFKEVNGRTQYTITGEKSGTKTGNITGTKWLYIKEVLIETTGGGRSYIGVGMKQWTEPMFRQAVRYFDNSGASVSEADYNAMTDEERAERGITSETYYLNSAGQEVSEEEVINAQMTAPVIFGNNANNSTRLQPYVNAYRRSYEFPDNSAYKSDYFYVRTYSFSYTGEPTVVTDGLSPAYVAGQSNYVPWANTDEFKIENLFDGDPATYIHSGNGDANKITINNPAIITVDLGTKITANTLRLYTSPNNSNHRNAFPKDFKIEGSLDGKTYFEMGSWTGASAPALSFDFALTKEFTFRYYKMTTTATRSGTDRFALYDLQFIHTLRITGSADNRLSLDDDMFSYKGNWKASQELSKFGHVYNGAKGSELSFKMTGTRVGFILPDGANNNFEVYVDGSKVNSIEMTPYTDDGGITYLTYLSEKFKSGTHTIKLVCTGKVKIDSVVYFNEAD
ncbi:MAG: M60 family metallopeptidase [Clostridiales bacterium]|nr:M60 family metallopeptidase [Clostridiales bacterium]